MRSAAVLSLLVTWLALPTSAAATREPDPSPAPPPIEYRISLAEREHHELRVEVHFTALPPAPLAVRMSRTSPGRYALHEFAKNVYDVEVTGADGRGLAVERPDLHQWTVLGHDGEVLFRYTLFGDRCDGTYAAIDETHAHLNAPATFVWARGLEGRPVRVRIDDLPSDWQVATQLEALEDGRTYAAPDLAYLIDSPLEIGDVERYAWEIGGRPGVTLQTVELVLHHEGTAAEAETFSHLAKLVVDEQIAIFGEAPAFDFGRYTFLADYLPWAIGDGMEHRNSTVLTSPTSIAEDPIDLLGTIAHEFFHAWNVERIRPRSLEPFDLEAANVSRELWFGEGFTSYYGELTLVRIGALSLESYAEALAETLQRVLNAPGRTVRSPAEMSARAPFVDAATANDPTNDANTFISYYTYGSALALALDLELRRLDPALSLDAFMRAAWERFGRPETPYTNAELEVLLAEVSGDADFAADFFRRSIEGREPPDFAPLLARAGLLLRPARPGTAWIGDVSLAYDGDGARLETPSGRGSPLHDAGVDRGDVLLRLDGHSLLRPEDLEEILEQHSPGDVVELDVETRAGERQVEVTLAEDPALEVVTFEAASHETTPVILDFRLSWLGPKASPRTTLHRYCPETGEPYPLAHAHCPVHGAPLGLIRPE